MYSYKEFPSQVLLAVKPIAEEYDLSVKKITDDHLVEFENEFCELSFYCDHGNLNVSIKMKSSNTNFRVYDIVKFLYQEIPLLTEDYYYGSLKAALWYTDICTTYLGHVLQGDASWVNALTELKEYEQKVFLFVYTGLDKNHLIRKKFDNNDPTWFKDAEEMLKNKRAAKS